jgi:hypothetical protein
MGMKGFVFQQLSNMSTAMQKGMWHTLGAAPQLGNDAAAGSWRFLGKAFQITDPATGAFKFKQLGNAPGGLGAVEAIGTMAALGVTGAMTVQSFRDEGFSGGTGQAIGDIAINAAIVKHGYAGLKAATIRQSGMGMATAGLVGRSITGYGGGLAGMALGGAIGSMLPGFAGTAAGMTLGTVGAYAGATVGVKHGGKLGLAAAGLGLGLAGANLAYGVAKAGYNHVQMQKRIDTSGSMAAFHTRGAHTMRARAVQAIHKNHLNARSALGQEASYMHMPSRNYHSRYRM